MSPRKHCNSILALVVIAHFAEIDWDVTGMESVLFDFERSRFIIISSVSGVTHRWANGTQVPESGHDEVLPIYCEDLTDRDISRFFSQWDCQTFSKRVTILLTIICWRKKTL